MSPAELKRQAEIQLTVIQVIAEAARESGTLGTPCGPIYAALMGKLPQITPDYFAACIGYLVRAGVVRRSNDCLYFAI